MPNGSFVTQMVDMNGGHRTLEIPEVLMGLGRLELPTSRLSGVRSNHLSYRPRSTRGAGTPRSMGPRYAWTPGTPVQRGS